MANRALVIGSQTGVLSGVENDARNVAAFLEDRKFNVDLRAASIEPRSSPRRSTGSAAIRNTAPSRRRRLVLARGHMTADRDCRHSGKNSA
jgi:hypothetical protein